MGRLRSHGWWVMSTLAVATGLGLVLGYPLAWLAYAAFNIAGVWLFCGRNRSRRSQIWMKSLAIAMVPVGVIGAFARGGSDLTPTQAATVGADDAATRSESIRASGLFNRGSV